MKGHAESNIVFNTARITLLPGSQLQRLLGEGVRLKTALLPP